MLGGGRGKREGRREKGGGRESKKRREGKRKRRIGGGGFDKESMAAFSQSMRLSNVLLYLFPFQNGYFKRGA